VEKFKMNDLKSEIDILVAKWEKDNAFRSNINLNDLSYKSIVKLGRPAVPHLLSLLGSSWIVIAALHEITGEEVYENNIYGMFNKINDAWKNWGKDKGYI